jgi:hypothetical protein
MPDEGIALVDGWRIVNADKIDEWRPASRAEAATDWLLCLKAILSTSSHLIPAGFMHAIPITSYI